ncbi:hypothetical protein ACWCP6_12550 [Streptomyces sp. NPDC002004]
MPADEVHHEDSLGDPRARSGPRHAAPRKPLLTRLHVPAGKAIAIAAMPTAVLMGMGLTPTLAQAKPLPKNPFQDGPCVTANDEAGKDTQADQKDQQGSKDSTKEPSASPSPSGDRTGSGSDSGSGSGSGDKTEPTPTPSSSAQPTGDETKTPEPTPTASKESNPLDPLGVGDALGNLLGGGSKDSASPTPSPSATSDGSGSGSKDSGSVVDKVTKPVTDTVDKAAGTAKDTADKTGDTVKDTVKKAEDAATPSPSASDSAAPDADGKKPFPCVVEKKVAGKDETAPVQIPNQPWYLEASSLLLKGLDYKGVVNLTMPNGQTKQVLKFTVDNGTDIGDLHQIVDGPGGKKYHVQAAPGSTSTIRNGRTTMYTERLQGNLFGLIPIVFDPEHPPPLNVPIAYFTKVKVTQAGQFGGDLTVPGLHQSITD